MLWSSDGSFWSSSLPIFDFSLKFEESILQILPSASFLFFAAAIFCYYVQTKVRIRQSNLLWTKVSFTLVLCALELVNLILRRLSDTRTETTDAAAALDFLAALAVAGVVYVEHRHAIQTSALLGLYLAIGTLLDGTKSRSYFKRDLIASGAVAAATCVVRFALVVLEEVPKTRLIIDPSLRSVSDGEATCGFFGRMLFIFLRSMMRTGYRRKLELNDLASLGSEFASAHLFARLMDSWPDSRRGTKNSLFFACCKAFIWDIVLIIIPRLIATGCMFAQPFVMYEVIGALMKPNDDRTGSLIGAVLLTFLGATLSRATVTRLNVRLTTRVRGALLASVFDKSYRLKLSEAKEQAAITLMSADFDGVAEGIPNCIEVPVSILESGLGMYFLSRFIRQSSLILLGPLLLSTTLGYTFGKFRSPALKYWNEHIQDRVTKTSHVISQLPAIKALGLAPKVEEFIQRLRVIETTASRRFRYIHAMSTGWAVMFDRMTPVLVVVIGIYTHKFGDKLNAEIVYPTLSIVTLVQLPLAHLLRLYPAVISMLGCVERFRTFLGQDEHEDPRKTSHMAPDETQEKASTSSGCYVDREKTNRQSGSPAFRFENATMAPRGAEEAVLKNVDLSIDRGSITSMFGPTGSGKTTLAESMLGEAELFEGGIYIDEAIEAVAVCGQEVYLPNVTIEECIIGACPYDPVWFNTVVTVCKLVQDLQQLPNGQKYVIGSGGIALSGGQRQRIGIARAVFSKARTIILDDSFSALDKRTALDILFGLCGQNGLLRQLNCTVLLSSYLSECVDVADNLILLDGDGNVSFEPTASNGKVQLQVTCLLEQGLLGGQEEEEANEDEYDEDEADGVNAPARNVAATTQQQATETSGGVQREAPPRRKGSQNLYLLWVNAVGRMAMLAFTLGIFLMALAESFPTIYMRIWIELAPGNKNYLIGYSLISVSAGLLSSMCLYVMFVKLAPRASIGLHKKLIGVTTRATLGYLSTTDAGELVNRYSEDMDGLSKHVPAKVYSMFYLTFTVLMHTAAILAGTTYMSFILPVVGGCVWFVQKYYLRTSVQLRVLEIASKAPMVSSLRDISDGLVYIRAFRTQKYEYARCLYRLDQAQKPYYYLLTSQSFLSLVLDSIVTVMALTLAVLALYVKDTTSPSATGLAFLNLTTLGRGLNMLVDSWTAMQTSVGSLSRLRDFLRDTPTEKSRAEVELPENWPSRGEVIFSGVAARYKLNDEKEEPEVLRDIDLHIQPGKKIGVMGRTGSGKSSLIYAMLGFLEYEGTISIDDVEVKATHLDQLRSRIITISQDVVELDGTIRDNLLPYDKSWDPVDPEEMTLEQRQEAERKDRILRETLVRLRIWDQLPRKGGLDAVLKLVGYSHGEKQLLCIARAVVRRRLTGSKLVLVDEATASVDTGRDQIVREMMVEYFRECTIIVVAHREETIADSNQTVHLAYGCVAGVEDFDNVGG